MWKKMIDAASKSTRCPGSFRDSAGSVFDGGDVVLRTIQESFAENWRIAGESGFLESALQKELLIPFEEARPLPGSWKTLRSPKLPLISFPYEWCFGQLKDAALHTLDIMDEALRHGLILRDATAYNIQFFQGKPLFIDLLSFEKRDAGKPWQAYGQFCRFFLAPLALMARRSPVCGRFLRDWIEGIPLDLASSLLPYSTRFSPSLAIHVHYHARLQARYADPRKAAKKIRAMQLDERTVPNLSKALRLAVEGLRLPRGAVTEWGEYYADTNYSAAAADDKRQRIEGIVEKHVSQRELALDVGANTARYSAFLGDRFRQVAAVDIDYLAVEKLWRHVRERKLKNVLPLVLDLCNPSPAIGWDNAERPNFKTRFAGDYLSALAVIHHLVFTGGIPLEEVARGFAHLLGARGILALEWVPREDSQVQRLLAARDTADVPYGGVECRAAFSRYFDYVERYPIVESKRELLVFCKKDASE